MAEAGKIVGAERKSLNPGQFHSYLAHLTAGMKQPAFEELAAYLRACIKPCSEGEAEARREGRRRLLSQLLLDGKTSGLQLNTVLQTVVNTIENVSLKRTIEKVSLKHTEFLMFVLTVYMSMYCT